MQTEVTTPRRDLARYVVDRGLVSPAVPITVSDLVGGVSGEVVLVSSGGTSMVVKRALAQLDVQAVWTAKPERALTEAAALAYCHALAPDNTPAVLDVDTEQLMFTMTAAPPQWSNWKTVLLSLDDASDDLIADQLRTTAVTLGTVLATWHRASWHDPEVAARFDDYEAFEQLRLTPFHRATAERHPQLRDALLGCADELLTIRQCLVHGDFSPKNILVGEGTWVLDFEVAHVGAAVFDLAFMHAHLILKALQLPREAALLAETARHLTAAYSSAMAQLGVPDGISRHTSSLLMARVDGMSPATYLSEAAAQRVRRVAAGGLTEPDLSVRGLWDDVLATAAGALRGRV